jgi:hypothetical protein
MRPQMLDNVPDCIVRDLQEWEDTYSHQLSGRRETQYEYLVNRRLASRVPTNYSALEDTP